MNQTIEKSLQPVKFQLAVLGVSGFLLSLFASRLIRAFDDVVTDIDLSGLAKISWLLVIGFTILAMILAWINSKSAVYELTKDSIIIGGSGLSGASNKKVYSVLHVTSVSVKQTWFGRKYNYGRVIVNMDRLEDNRTLRLVNIIDPGKVADQITGLQRRHQ
jgi:hypothetical protein